MSEVVRTEKMAAGGDAIAHLPDGRVVFVRGALPDESVAVRISQSKRDYAKADVVDVVEPSAHRVQPPCPWYHAGCGGCPWQFIDPNHQLPLKQSIVVDALRRTARLVDARVEIGGAVPPWAYRTSMRLATTAEGSLGLRARATHDVIDLDGCLIAHPLLEDLLLRVHTTGRGEVALRVASATGERSAWVADGDVAITDVPDDAGVGPTALVHEHVGEAAFRVSAPSFFQSGPAAAELLTSAVLQACAGADRGTVVDAYGGIGLFARAVHGDAVIVVEGSESACADAVVNLTGLDATVVCTTVEQWQPVPADLVIADPSRHGLGKRAVDVIADTAAPHLVLVSCDPVALARDTALLRDRGYHHEVSTVLDLFPQTPHVEVVTSFARTA